MSIKIHIINLVYGKEFTKYFLDISLKSQLTSENLRYLSKQKNLDVTYFIYSNEETIPLLKNSQTYQELLKIISVQLIIVSTKDFDTYKILNNCHRIALSKAYKKNAALIFLAADIVCSNNMFKNLCNYLFNGYRCVAISAIRLSKQSFIKDLKLKHKKIDLSPRELVNLALQHIHPACKALFHDSEKMPSGWCSQLYWKINSKNLLMRSFHLHPLLLWPEKQTNLLFPIDANLIGECGISNEKIQVVTNSDTFVMFEFTDEKNLHVFGNLIDRNDQYIAKWCHNHTESIHWKFINSKIYFKSESENISWKAIEQKSDEAVQLIKDLFLIQNTNFKKNVFFEIHFLLIIKNKLSSLLKNNFFYHSIKKNLNIFFQISKLTYQSKFAPYIAKNYYWLFWPMYKLLKFFNICFIVNIGGGVGHTIIELDNFFRMRNLDKNLSLKKYILLQKPCTFSKTVIKLYKHKFNLAIANNFWYFLLLPILIKFKDITIDVGLSRLKWQLTDDNKYFPPLKGQTYLHQLSKQDGNNQYKNYFKLRQKTSNYYPLKFNPKLNTELISFIGGIDKKIALIQIKECVLNATALKTDPNTYLKSLDYLQKLNYNIIFIGREKMPPIFKRYSLINYSESHLASFENDLILFNLASLAIISGSGLAYLGDCIDLPYLYLNSWTIQFFPPSPNCIFIPTLVKDKSNKLLTFSEQIELYDSLKDEGAEIFPENQYIPVNATDEDILHGLKELLNDKKTLASKLQEKMKGKHDILYYNNAKYSNHFLKKHKNLI